MKDRKIDYSSYFERRRSRSKDTTFKVGVILNVFTLAVFLALILSGNRPSQAPTVVQEAPVLEPGTSIILERIQFK